MLTRPLPGSDLHVSVIGLGCWALGGAHWGDDDRPAALACLQTPYSLLRREFEGGLRAASQGLGVLAYEPLCRGLLAGGHRPPFAESDLRSRDDRYRGPHPSQVLSQGHAALQPAGARRPEQVDQNVRASELLHRAALWDVVGRIAAVHEGS